MASICPVCSTENRDGANFCKSCGTTLSATTARMPPAPSPPGSGSQADREWATTAPAQLRAPTIPAPLFDLPEPAPSSRSFFGRAPAAAPGGEPTVILASGQPPASVASSGSERSERKRARVKVPRTPEPPEPPLRQRGLMLWLGLLAVAVVMVVAGWYGYGTRKAAEPVEAPPPVAAPAPAPAPAPALAPAAAPAAVEPPAAEPAAAQTPTAEAPAAEAAPVAPAAPKPNAKPRKQATAAPSAPAPDAPAPAPATAAPPPAPAAAPTDPQSLCGDRNFIAKAQCMATQCLKPEFKASTQCEAVRRQQRLEEEKRNPTLIN
jgi:hypothetical protein